MSSSAFRGADKAVWTMDGETLSSEIIKQSIDWVNPSPERPAEYETEFRFAVLRIKKDVAPMDDWPSPGEIARQSRAIEGTAAKLSRLLRDLGLPLSHWILKGAALDSPVDIEALRAQLDCLAKEAGYHADGGA